MKMKSARGIFRFAAFTLDKPNKIKRNGMKCNKNAWKKRAATTTTITTKIFIL